MYKITGNFSPSTLPFPSLPRGPLTPPRNTWQRYFDWQLTKRSQQLPLYISYNTLLVRTRRQISINPFFLPTPKHEKAKGIMRKGKSEWCKKGKKKSMSNGFLLFFCFFHFSSCLHANGLELWFGSFSFRGIHSIHLRKVRNWLLKIFEAFLVSWHPRSAATECAFLGKRDN